MPYHETMRTSGKPSISNQGHIIPQAPSHYGGGWREHFTHTRTSFRTFIPDYNHISFNYSTIQNPIQGFFLGIENSCSSPKKLPFFSGYFCDCSVSSKIPAQNHKVTSFSYRIFKRLYYLLTIFIRLNVFQIFTYCLPCHSHAVPMKQVCIQKHFHQGRQSAYLDKICH